jgi:16S rRNA (guanine527-N7)-methyltransferase
MSSSGLLDAWLEAVVATPGLTGFRDLAGARRALLDDSLRAAGVLRELDGPVVDVGSGNGAPGFPLAALMPERDVVLLEANARKCGFLERWAARLPNVRVLCGRAEEQPIEQYGVALAKALAPPPVAAEWCLPLVRQGGAAVLWVGTSADGDAVARVSERLGGAPPVEVDGLLVLRKVAATPPGFPRRPGIARKRPLV